MWKYELPITNHHKADRYLKEIFENLLKMKRFEEMKDMYEEGEEDDIQESRS
jgi:hypothetical protein